jgi:hypothetical protein
MKGALMTGSVALHAKPSPQTVASGLGGTRSTTPEATPGTKAQVEYHGVTESSDRHEFSRRQI